MIYVNLRDVLTALQDVHFPAGKQDLLQAAAASGAAGDVQAALRAIPPEQYRNRNEVARAVHVDPAEGLSPAQHAGQARKGGEPGLPGKFRDVSPPPVEDELGGG